jgi:hypothetical protein
LASLEANDERGDRAAVKLPRSCPEVESGCGEYLWSSKCMISSMNG